MKSTMPDELKNRCHQCRKPNPTTKEAVERLREWVDKGEAWAQTLLGQWYRDGNCGLKQSYVMAAMLYEKAVAQGNPNAMYELACLYRKGQGVVQSFKKAAELYTITADQGQVNAMYNLGIMYWKGQGVDQSNELACEWWTKAANEGHEKAMENLKWLDKNEGKSTTASTTAASPPPPSICLFVVQQTTTQWTYLSKMHGMPHGAILQQRLPTSTLESRRAQTTMQAIEKKEKEKKGAAAAAAKIKKCKIFIR